MQLNKQLVILGVTASMVPTLSAAGGDEIGIKHTYYKEKDDRMSIKFTNANFKYDIGADYTLNINLGYDSISGGTPIWDSASGASNKVEKENNDATSGASPCMDKNGLYICKETSNPDITEDGTNNINDFAYRKVHVKDTRKAANFSLTKRTESRDEITFGTSYSKESDFKSIEGSFSYLYNLDSTRNKTLQAGFSYQHNKAKHSEGWKDFNIINAEVGYTHIFTKNTLASVNFFGILQDGTLSNPYQKIIRYFDVSLEDEPYFKYFKTKEKRPDKRKALGVSTKFITGLTANTALHGNYRLYKDDWGILSHTFETSLHVDVTKRFSLVPFVRYYTQSKAVFYKNHDSENFTFSEGGYGSNDERLGKYNTFAYGLGVVGKITKDFSANAYYVHQDQSTDLEINYVSFGLKYNF